MITIQEIKDYKNYLIKDYHGQRVNQQLKMQQFYDDDFPVPMITAPKYLSRTGTAPSLVDAPASHIITRNPQVFVEPKRQTGKHRESAEKVNALLNHWVRRILKQSPQPMREFVKNLLLRGEGWVHPVINEDWDKEQADKHLPVLFLTPDPVNIFGSPVEKYGVPECVVVSYEMSPILIHMAYPDWNYEGNKKLINWMEYWREDVRYFEADGQPVLKDGIQENVMGFVPFVHAYSGFGKESPDGRPETLAVGRLDKVTNLLIQECAINSDIDSTIHKFAHERIDIFIPEGSDVDEKGIKEQYDAGVGALNIVKGIPPGNMKEGTRILPSAEAFQHYNNIRARIMIEAPPIMSGLPSGTSGRQEDIVGYHFIRRFDSIVEATEDAFGKAFDMGRQILTKVPTWLPISQWLEQPEGGTKEVNIDEDDLVNCTDSAVKLKAADPVEDDRRLMAGKLLYDGGHIDEETFLIEYAGYTPEKAQQIIVKRLAQNVMQTPALLAILSSKALEKLGMAEELKALEQEQQIQKEMQGALQKKNTGGMGSQGGEPRNFNQQSSNPEARKMADMMMTQRGIRAPAMAGGGNG